MEAVPAQMSQSQSYQHGAFGSKENIMGPSSVALVGANTAVADALSSDFGAVGILQPNIDGRFLRCTMNKFPRTAAQLAKTRLPFGVTVTFYPSDPDVSDPALQVPQITGPIVRCGRCRTYLNPAVEIVEAGMRWRCNLCFLTNNFPPGYDSAAGPDIHPELHSFVYDFANAPVEYTVRPPMPPIFVFVIDVTASAILSGFTATALRVIQEELDSIPNDDGRTRVSFIAIDASLHFFQVQAATEGKDSTAAKLLVVSDAAEPFLPAAPSDLLLTVADCRTRIDDLLTSIPRLFDPPSPSSPSFGPALRAAHSLLKSSGGKIVCFLASRPSRHEGALKDRNEAKLYNTPKETTLLTPENNFYKLLATESVKDQVSVDLFLAPPSQAYLDIATISGLAKYTGGRLFYYPGFNAARSEDVDQFSGDLRRFLGLEHNWEAVLRIRASQGLSLAAYHGSFFLRQTDLLALPSVNPDNSYSAQLVVEENLVGSRASLQAALLHTTSHGERRIRVVNFVAPVTEDPRDILLSASLPGIVGVLPKMAVEKIYGYNLQDSREAVKNKVIDVVSAYMSCLGIKPQSHHNAVLPENLKLLPLFMLSLLKSPVLRGSNASGALIPADYRSYYMSLFKTLSCEELCRALLPSFFAIHSMDGACGLPDESDASKIVLPSPLTLSSERLERHGIFLLSTGMEDFLWVGSAAHPELLKLLFGVESAMELPPPGRFTLPDLDNDWSRRMHAIRNELHRRHLRHTAVPLYLVREEANLDVC
jgi:protein transport protein SEC24